MSDRRSARMLAAHLDGDTFAQISREHGIHRSRARQLIYAEAARAYFRSLAQAPGASTTPPTSRHNERGEHDGHG